MKTKINKKRLSDTEFVLEYLDFIDEFTHSIYHTESIFPNDLYRINIELERFAGKYSKANPENKSLAWQIRSFKLPSYLVKEPFWKGILKYLFLTSPDIRCEDFESEEINDEETLGYLSELIDGIKTIKDAFRGQ